MNKRPFELPIHVSASDLKAAREHEVRFTEGGSEVDLGVTPNDVYRQLIEAAVESDRLSANLKGIRRCREELNRALDEMSDS